MKNNCWPGERTITLTAHLFRSKRICHAGEIN